jgi:hypothetical protein
MLPDGDISLDGGICANIQSMPLFTHLVDGLFGLAAVSSFAGFVFHLLTGNPDMALLCFVGVGGSAAMVWMFSSWRRA